MIKLKQVDATKGSLTRAIFLYTVPLMLSHVVQVLFNSADIAILGFAADDVAVAAVGATAAIIHLLVNTFYGLSGGARVVLARLLGEGNAERVKKTVDTVFMLVLMIGVGVSLFGILFSPWFLRISQCPAECFRGAQLYLRLYLLSAPAMLLYNCGSAVISVDGDTQRPLLFIIMSGIMKIVLNLLFCALLPNKVLAVAISTLISNYFSATLVLLRLMHLDSMCRLSLRSLRFSWYACRSILRFGIPSMVTGVIFPIANLQIQTAVNSFGTATVAGNSAICQVENVVGAFSCNSFMTTALTFVGQNVGAGKPQRVKRSIQLCCLYSGGIGLVLGTLALVFGTQIMGLLLPGETEAIADGLIRGKYLLSIYWMISITQVLLNAITAFGFNMLATVANTATIIGTRVLWMLFVFPRYPTKDCLFVCFTISWVVLFLLLLAIFIYVYFYRYKKNRISSV